MLKPYYLFVERQISRLLSVFVSDGAIRASLVLHDREVEILRLFCRGCKWLFCLSESVKILHCVPPPFLSGYCKVITTEKPEIKGMKAPKSSLPPENLEFTGVQVTSSFLT